MSVGGPAERGPHNVALAQRMLLNVDYKQPEDIVTKGELHVDRKVDAHQPLAVLTDLTER